MPRVSVWLIRTALLYLVAGAGLGGMLLAWPGIGGPHWWRAHAELMLIGWTLQLALGVAYWILPKHAAGSALGPKPLALAIYPALNVGIAVCVVAWLALLPAIVLTTGRLLEFSAVGMFAIVAWRRVKAFGAGRRAVA